MGSPDRRAREPDARFPLRPFIAVCVLAFILLCEYELVRAGVESLYVEANGAEALTQAWLAVAISMALTVAAYQSLASRWPLRRLFIGGSLASAALLLGLLALHRAEVPGAALGLYVWKDVHVVVLLEMLWTHAAHRFDLKSARWSYGFILFSGSLGGLAGGLLAGPLATTHGTGPALKFASFLFVILALFGPLLEAPLLSERGPRLGEALGALRRSRYVQLLLALVLVVQIVITVIDYQYNQALEASFPDTDARTAMGGRIYAAISIGSMALQLLSGAILRVGGVRRALLAVPTLLGACVLGFALTPRFAWMAIAKVASKVLDYSLFRAAKEVLYLPLSATEKTHGKAVVDMLGYRVAKGGASLVLMTVVALTPESAPISGVGLALIGAWVGITLPLTRLWKAKLR